MWEPSSINKLRSIRSVGRIRRASARPGRPFPPLPTGWPYRVASTSAETSYRIACRCVSGRSSSGLPLARPCAGAPDHGHECQKNVVFCVEGASRLSWRAARTGCGAARLGVGRGQSPKSLRNRNLGRARGAPGRRGHSASGRLGTVKTRFYWEPIAFSAALGRGDRAGQRARASAAEPANPPGRAWFPHRTLLLSLRLFPHRTSPLVAPRQSAPALAAGRAGVAPWDGGGSDRCGMPQRRDEDEVLLWPAHHVELCQGGATCRPASCQSSCSGSSGRTDARDAGRQQEH